MRTMVCLTLAVLVSGCGEVASETAAVADKTPAALQGALDRAEKEGKAVFVHLGGPG